MLRITMANTFTLLSVRDRKSWRAWLYKHHALERGVWLVMWKIASGKHTLSYEEAVEEALCFGWIDSIVKRLDDDRFARKFTPRTNTGKWSALNVRRFEKVKAAGLVTEAGLRVFAPEPMQRVVASAKVNVAIPSDLAHAFAKDAKAHQFFLHLARSYRNQYVGWITAAKRPETRARRIAEAVRLLASEQKLGMK